MAIQYYDGVNIVGGFKVGDSLASSSFEVESGGDILVNTVLKVSDDFELSGAFYDSSNQSGTSGQILSSTSNGTDWIDAPSGGSSPWTTDTNGITYTAGNVGIGMASVAGIDLAVDGLVRLYDGFRVNGNTQMDGELNVLGSTSLSGDLSLNGNDVLTEGGDILDKNDSTGTSGQVLSSGGSGGGVDWIDAPSGGGAQLLSYNFSAIHTTNDTGKYYQFRNQDDSTMYDRRATFTSWGGIYYVDLVAPDDCFLKSFTIKSRNGSTWSSGLQIKMRIHKNVSTREYDGSFVTSTGSGNDGKITFDLTSSDTSFSQGDAVSIGFNCTGAMGYVTAMAIFELT